MSEHKPITVMPTIDENAEWQPLERQQIRAAAIPSAATSSSSVVTSASSSSASSGSATSDVSNTSTVADEKLILAVQNADVTAIQRLITAHVDLNLPDEYGKTVLMKAASYGYDNIVKLLLDNGAQVDLRDKNGWTALKYATVKRLDAIAELLEQAEAEAEKKPRI